MTEQSAFILESIIRRVKGTHPHMPPTAESPAGVQYHFMPSVTDERHLCLVYDRAHVARFLSIPEAYRIVGAPAASVAVAAMGTDGGGAGGGAPIQHPPRGAEPSTLGPTVNDPDGNPPSLNTPQSTPPAPQPPINPFPAPLPANLADMTEEQLRDVFEAEVGRKPSIRAKAETMIAQIEAARTDKTVRT